MVSFEPGVSLILGGARSGKSTFAERLAGDSGLKKVYVATSQAFDGEMVDRIAAHKARRGPDWALVEEPLALAETVSKTAKPDCCLLVDCLTLWMTNLMMAERDVSRETSAFAGTLEELAKECSVLLVSNEVGHGIVPVDKMAREFRDHAGRLHQEVASIADHVWLVTAGLPQKLK